MISDKLQYFSVDSQQLHQPQNVSERWNQSRSTSSHNNRSSSGGKQKIHNSSVQIITPTKKEENDIKQNITSILTQILQRSNNIPIDTQQYLKERFNVSSSNQNLSTNSAFQSTSPQKHNMTFSSQNKNERNQRSFNSILQKKKENEKEKIQYLDYLIQQEIKEQNEDKKHQQQHSPSFHEPNAKLQVDQILKNKENFYHTQQFNSGSEQKSSSENSILKRASQSSSTLLKSQSSKKGIQSERILDSKQSYNIGQERQTESSQKGIKKDLVNIDQQSIQLQGSESKNAQPSQRIHKMNQSATERKQNQSTSSQNNKSHQESSKRNPNTFRKSINSSTSKTSTSVKRNLNSTISFQEDVTVYQRVLRQRQQSLTSESQEKDSQNKQSRSSQHFSSINTQTKAKGGRQTNYDSVKKELFRDFQSFSDQFLSENNDTKSQTHIYQSLSSKKKEGSQKLVKEYKKIVNENEELSQQNVQKKQQVSKLKVKLDKEISYLHKLKGMIHSLKGENKRMIEPLHNQNSKNDEKIQIEKSIKKQEYEIKQLEKENLSYQSQLKKALEELQYWQNRDKPKEIKMSLNNSVQSSIFNPDQPQVNIRISQSDIYSAISGNIYNGQTYNQS